MSVTTTNRRLARTAAYGLAALLAVFSLVAARAANQDRLTGAELLLARAQRICPVTGQDLGSMGGPIRTEIEGRTVFLCCRGCVGKPVRPEHWDRIEANLIAAQGKCPVFDEPLPRNPQSTVVNGRAVYVCCASCIRKVEAEPDKYLAVVDRFLQERVPGERRGVPAGGAVPVPPGAANPPAVAPPGQEHASPAIYTCPMHPQVQWPRPAKCPLCDMTLVLREGGPRPPGPIPMPMGPGAAFDADRPAHHEGMHDAQCFGCRPSGGAGVWDQPGPGRPDVFRDPFYGRPAPARWNEFRNGGDCRCGGY